MNFLLSLTSLLCMSIIASEAFPSGNGRGEKPSLTQQKKDNSTKTFDLARRHNKTEGTDEEYYGNSDEHNSTVVDGTRPRLPFRRPGKESRKDFEESGEEYSGNSTERDSTQDNAKTPRSFFRYYRKEDSKESRSQTLDIIMELWNCWIQHKKDNSTKTFDLVRRHNKTEGTDDEYYGNSDEHNSTVVDGSRPRFPFRRPGKENRTEEAKHKIENQSEKENRRRPTPTPKQSGNRKQRSVDEQTRVPKGEEGRHKDKAAHQEDKDDRHEEEEGHHEDEEDHHEDEEDHHEDKKDYTKTYDDFHTESLEQGGTDIDPEGFKKKNTNFDRKES